MENFYIVDIKGRKERLPIIELEPKVRIAFFNLHGNPELTEFAGRELAKLLKDRDIEALITAESKGLQLTHVVARELGHSYYAVARKAVKVYMHEYIETIVKAITGNTSHSFYLSSEDAARLKGKRVAIVDDVVSSGGSLKGLKSLVEKSGGEVVACACVLAEGDSIQNQEIIRLANLPLL